MMTRGTAATFQGSEPGLVRSARASSASTLQEPVTPPLIIYPVDAGLLQSAVARITSGESS